MLRPAINTRQNVIHSTLTDIQDSCTLPGDVVALTEGVVCIQVSSPKHGRGEMSFPTTNKNVTPETHGVDVPAGEMDAPSR